jgi:hypothetical protein
VLVDLALSASDHGGQPVVGQHFGVRGGKHESLYYYRI